MALFFGDGSLPINIPETTSKQVFAQFEKGASSLDSEVFDVAIHDIGRLLEREYVISSCVFVILDSQHILCLIHLIYYTNSKL